MRSTGLIALAASLSVATAANFGFNYGSTQTDGSIKYQKDFENEFTTAKNLVGTSGWTSARLYTMLQGGTGGPISAIPAAISTGTTLLLGIWASGGQAGVDAEIAALKAAITQYPAFTKLVVGISVGSEDLYRESPIGIAAKAGLGANPSDITSYISQVRSAIAGTGLSGVPIGHVDTWTAWVNGSNSAVVAACDWIGVDAYPYFQSTEYNAIEVGKELFNEAYGNTTAVSQGKPVWITETGWPVSGAVSGNAVASTANAKTYWDQVACPLIGGSINTYWFTLQDAYPTTPNPSFGIVGTTLSTTPLYDLSCKAVASSSAAPAPASSSTPAAAPSSSAPAAAPSSSKAAAASSSPAAESSSPKASSTPAATSSPALVPSYGYPASSSSSMAVISSRSANMTTSSAAAVTSSAAATSAPAASSTGTSTFTGAAAMATGGSIIGAVGAMAALLAVL